jgi:hypothetical protein
VRTSRKIRKAAPIRFDFGSVRLDVETFETPTAAAIFAAPLITVLRSLGAGKCISMFQLTQHAKRRRRVRRAPEKSLAGPMGTRSRSA